MRRVAEADLEVPPELRAAWKAWTEAMQALWPFLCLLVLLPYVLLFTEPWDWFTFVAMGEFLLAFILFHALGMGWLASRWYEQAPECGCPTCRAAPVRAGRACRRPLGLLWNRLTLTRHRKGRA